MSLFRAKAAAEDTVFLLGGKGFWELRREEKPEVALCVGRVEDGIRRRFMGCGRCTGVLGFSFGGKGRAREGVILIISHAVAILPFTSHPCETGTEQRRIFIKDQALKSMTKDRAP